MILDHHNRKYSDDSRVSNPRGASAIAGAVDSIMQLTQKDGVIHCSFDLRYDEAPDEMIFKRNPETLWLERYALELEADHNNVILKMVQGKGPEGRPMIEIVKALREQFDTPERTCRHQIRQLAKATGILKVVGPGNAKRVILTNEME